MSRKAGCNGKRLAVSGRKTDRNTDMIVKLCRPGFEICVVADLTTSQVCDNGSIDFRIIKGGAEAYRCEIRYPGLGSETPEQHPVFDRAYVMENGKTVDRIQP
jgi:hypothetical protein